MRGSMLEVVINQAVYVQENLEQQRNFLNNQIWELERVMQDLNGLSDMSGPLSALRRERERLQESKRTLDEMAQCLDKTILYYNICENRIYDYVQQEAIVYRRHTIGTDSPQNTSGLPHSVLY